MNNFLKLNEPIGRKKYSFYILLFTVTFWFWLYNKNVFGDIGYGMVGLCLLIVVPLSYLLMPVLFTYRRLNTIGLKNKFMCFTTAILIHPILFFIVGSITKSWTFPSTAVIFISVSYFSLLFLFFARPKP